MALCVARSQTFLPDFAMSPRGEGVTSSLGHLVELWQLNTLIGVSLLASAAVWCKMNSKNEGIAPKSPEHDKQSSGLPKSRRSLLSALGILRYNIRNFRNYDAFGQL
jgi:hypothetical protein